MSTTAALKPLHELETVVTTTIASFEKNGFTLSKAKLMALLISETATGCSSVDEYRQRLIIQGLKQEGKGDMVRAITAHITDMLSKATIRMMPENRLFYDFVMAHVWRQNTFHDARYDAADEMMCLLAEAHTSHEYSQIAWEILTPLNTALKAPNDAWSAALKNSVWSLLDDLKTQLLRIQPKLRKYLNIDDPFGSISDSPDFQAALALSLSNIDWVTAPKQNY
ncbi:hypothetical protein RYA05_13455 [Pseudomonas syringae pv. actinidiae]|nr:hypothetical protein [Pseudomonas syringae pv. actinidiae]